MALNSATTVYRKTLDCNGNVCRNCGNCRDWMHNGRHWYRTPNATCEDYRYWHFVIYRHPPAFQRGIGRNIIGHNGFHRGISGLHGIFDCPTYSGSHDLCECRK